MSNLEALADRTSGTDVDPAVHLARANLYRYLSVAVLPPDDRRFELLRDDRFRRLVRAAVEWLRADALFRPRRLGPGELDPGELEPWKLLPAADEVADAYVEVFGLSVSKDCPPHEIEYHVNRDISFRSQHLADAAGFYRAFGLERATTARERLDHLSFEAEFMQVLIARHLYAVEEDLGEVAVEVCRRAQRRFFVDHLGWWLPAFGVRLIARTSSPFYRGLGLLARALTASERAVLGLPPFTEVPDVNLDRHAPEGSCFGCGLDEVDGTTGASGHEGRPGAGARTRSPAAGPRRRVPEGPGTPR